MKQKIFAIIASIALMAPTSVGALTADELQTQINALLAQLTALQTQLSTLQGTTPTVSGCTITSFDRNLSQGISGDDVKCLQIVLNSASDTQLAASGVGSSGNETSYFGPLTKAAVIKFQEKYASEVLASWGLTSGTGYVGSTTRAKLNTMLATGEVPTTPTTPTEPTTPTTPVGAGLTVALASDTPATSTLVSGGAANTSQSIAPLAKFTLTNGDSSEVKLTQLKLKRIGVSADTTLSNVYLMEGAKRLTDSASVASTVITFSDSSGIIAIPAGSSKTITVVSDIAASTSGQTVGASINAATDITSTASAVNGTFPLNGNLMSIASGTLATVDLADSTTPSTADVTPQNDYTMWQNIVSINTRAVYLNRVSFREIGTIQYADLQNFRLYVDGVQVGSVIANLDSNGYLTFDLSASPSKLETGARTIKMVGDIIAGSSRNFKFRVSNAADINFEDSQYNVNVLPTTNATTYAFSASTAESGVQSVSSGVVTVSKKSDSPAANIVNTAPSVTLAKYEVKAAGEKVKIESLEVEVLWTEADTDNATLVLTKLANGKLLANGVQIGSTTNLDVDRTTLDASGTTFNLGSSLIVEPGSPVTLEVAADINGVDDNGNAVATAKKLESSDTLQVRLLAGSSNALGQVSSTSTSVPSAAVDGNAVTVASGALTLSKYTAYVNQSMVAPVTKAKLAHFTLTAGTTEAVNLNTITVDFDNTTYNTGTFDASTDLSNLYVTYGTNTTTTKATVADSANSWSVNYELAAGSTLDLIVYADAASGAGASGTAMADMTISGITKQSATTATGGETSGQVVAFSTGTLTTAAAGDTPLAQAVSGSSAADISAGTYKQVTAGKFKFTAQYDSYTIKELKVKVGSATISAALLKAILKDGSTVLGTLPFDTTDATLGANTVAYFTGLNVSVAANTNKYLTIDLLLSQPSADSSTSGVDAKVTLDYIKVYSSNGTEYTTGTTTDRAANSLYVYQSIPTFTENNLTNSVINNNANTKIYSFKAAADSKGSVVMKQLKFTLAWNDLATTGTLKLSNFKFYRGSTDLTGASVAIQNSNGVSVESTTGIEDGTATVNTTLVVTFNDGYEETVPAGETYTYNLYATPSSFAADTAGTYDSVSIYLAADAAHTTNKYVVDTSSSSTVVQLATSAGASAADKNIIWSDNSATLHLDTTAVAGSTATSSSDWADGYLILNLPLDTEAWQVQ